MFPNAPIVILSALSLTAIMLVIELTRRVLFGVSVFLASGPLFPGADRIGAGLGVGVVGVKAQSEYLLGLGIGDITG